MEIPQRDKVRFVTTVMNDLRGDLELFMDLKRCRMAAVLALHPSPVSKQALAELSGLDPNVGETYRMFQELEKRQYIVPVDRNKKPLFYLITREGRETAQTIIGMMCFAAENKLDDPKWHVHKARLQQFCDVMSQSMELLRPAYRVRSSNGLVPKQRALIPPRK